MSIIAYCGLLCNECPAYIATIEKDDKKKDELAKQWSSDDYVINAEDINCLGCSRENTGPIFKFCMDCEIRRCGISKDIDNCAHCDEYPCCNLVKLLEASPDSKDRLDQVKNSL